MFVEHNLQEKCRSKSDPLSIERTERPTTGDLCDCRRTSETPVDTKFHRLHRPQSMNFGYTIRRS